MSISKKQVEQERKNMRDVSEGVRMLQESRETIEKLAQLLDPMIDEAAKLGEDAYSDELIVYQVQLEDLAADLAFFELHVKVDAAIAVAFNKLKSLPAALTACKSLLREGPDMRKIGRQMASFRDTMDSARSDLKALRAELSSTKDPMDKILGKNTAEDAKFNAKVEAKKRGRGIRLEKELMKDQITPVPADAENVNDASDIDIDDITAVIDEENQKK